MQAAFVDDPEGAVAEADRVLTELMAERGYPTEGYEQQLADLSVEHASTLEHYRTAHDLRERLGSGEVTTEDMRTAMVHYRELFTDLLSRGGDANHGADADVRHDGPARDVEPDLRDADRDGRVDAEENRVDGEARAAADQADQDVRDDARAAVDRDDRESTMRPVDRRDADTAAETAEVERGRHRTVS